MKAQVYKGCGCNGHQCVGAQARNALAQLPLQTNGGAKDKGKKQTQQRVQDVRRIEVLKREHGGSLGGQGDMTVGKLGPARV